MTTGESVQKMSQQIRQQFNVAKYKSDRIIRTELNHFHNESDAVANEELGIKEYIFVATLDSRTSEVCRSHDGNRYKYKDKQTGVNYPPLHPNCRSVTRGYINKEVEKTITRRARDPITGETEIVKNISYNKWLEKKNIEETEANKPKIHKSIIYDPSGEEKIDKELLKQNFNRLNNLIAKYPKVEKYIKERGLKFGFNASGDSIATTTWTKDMKSIGINLNANFYDDIKKYNEEIITNINVGFFMPCSKENLSTYALTHEFGHVLETYLLKEYNISNLEEYEKALTNNYQWKKYKTKVYDNIQSEILKIAETETDDPKKFLSQYGGTSSADFFAESFANMLSGEINVLGRAMKKYLKGVL